MKTSGIYAIAVDNGKIYIGSSVNIERRWKTHQRDLRGGTHANNYLQRTYNKYGANAFTLTVLEICAREELYAREQAYIDALAPELRLNVSLVAAGGCGPHSVETRKKIGARHKGRIHSPEVRANMSAAHKGKTQSAEFVAKRTASLKGRRHTSEARARMSEAAKRRYEDPEFRQAHIERCKGRVHSDETRKKMSQSRAGTKSQALSDALTGRKRAANGSPYAGVALVGSRWVAQVTYNGKTKHVGAFATADEANVARLAFLARIRQGERIEREPKRSR